MGVELEEIKDISFPGAFAKEPLGTSLRKDFDEENKTAHPEKQGSTGFAAPEWASILENEGIKGGLHTVVVRPFRDLHEKLSEWRSYGTWVITWPVDENWSPDVIKGICASCAKQFKKGGRVVTAWIPCVQNNIDKWTIMMGV
ncbi:hypothetical protein OESDEN_12886 [Oesophagostomum dentatum]|uniref:Uncharacterized protein n=1 Tax=Oesophagostomum dentatum TaxID=61180 RepID=A0A0B1SUX3_OESDE|nr:hypothetical protein OESDEN_12886 [Oesophagostomum dentatum]